MTSDLTHETTDQLSNRRWNERLDLMIHAGVGEWLVISNTNSQ